MQKSSTRENIHVVNKLIRTIDLCGGTRAEGLSYSKSTRDLPILNSNRLPMINKSKCDKRQLLRVVESVDQQAAMN